MMMMKRSYCCTWRVRQRVVVAGASEEGRVETKEGQACDVLFQLQLRYL